MPVRITLTLSRSFRDYARERRDEAAFAWTAALRAATEGAKNDLRQQLWRAFPRSSRVGNIVGSVVFPRAPRVSLRAAGTVFPRGKPGSSAELVIEAFSQATVIRPRAGKRLLAIPTPFVPFARHGAERIEVLASRRSTRRMTPVEVEVEAHFNRELDFVPNKDRRGGGVLVLPGVVKGRRRGTVRAATPRRLAEGRQREDVVMFICVPAARLGKRLDLDAIAEKWAAAMPGLVERALPD